jgi:hypothetical protein
VRRALALALALAAVPSAARPQADAPGPTLTVTLQATDSGLEARLRTTQLSAAGELVSLLQSGFPLYVMHRVELWRARSNWFDQFISDVTWEVIVTYDPLSERFLTVRSDGARRVHRGVAELERALSTVYRVPLAAQGSGRFYSVASVEATPLSDSDLEETARWLRGDLPETATEQGGSVGDALARGARRLLVRAAGLSKVKLSARSARVTLPP